MGEYKKGYGSGIASDHWYYCINLYSTTGQYQATPTIHLPREYKTAEGRFPNEIFQKLTNTINTTPPSLDPLGMDVVRKLLSVCLRHIPHS